MKISIIIPAYNCDRYIRKCVESVKAQTYSDWECIIVDDASTDDTWGKIKELVDGDTRFMAYGRGEHYGAAGARNFGLACTNSPDAIFFLDADDWITPPMLSSLVAIAEKYPDAGRIFTPPIVDYENGKPSHKWRVAMQGRYEASASEPFKNRDYDLGHCTGCLYVLKNIPAELRFPEGVPVFEDMVFNMGLIFAGITTVVSQEGLYHYTRRRGSLVASYYYSKEDDASANEALDTLAAQYGAPKEMATRFHNFLNTAIIGRLIK